MQLQKEDLDREVLHEDKLIAKRHNSQVTFIQSVDSNLRQFFNYDSRKSVLNFTHERLTYLKNSDYNNL